MATTHGGSFYFILGTNGSDGYFGRPLFLDGDVGLFQFELRVKKNLVPIIDGQEKLAVPFMSDLSRRQMEILFEPLLDQDPAYHATLVDNPWILTGWQNVQLYSNLIPPESVPFEQLETEVLEQLGDAISRHVPNEPPVDAGPGIPAAYTYFGQLLAHDMSFMKWVNSAAWSGGSGGWVNAESLHALDFSSIFGTSTETGAKTSEWREHANSALGLVASGQPGFDDARDLPRAGMAGKHCCPDPRADLHLGLAQMHVLMTRFHQAAAVELDMNDDTARIATQKHLQAVVLTDYLPRIVCQNVYDSVMQEGRILIGPATSFLVPIEFAAACFRFGHSMVREDYVHWTIGFPPPSSVSPQVADLSTLLYYTADGGGLTINQQTSGWTQAWRHMVDHTNTDLPNTLVARPIQASIEQHFRNLDRARFEDAKDPTLSGPFNLAFQTLRRGAEIGLPSGQLLEAAAGFTNKFDIATFLDGKRLRFGALADNQDLHTNTPIWFFILAEAEALGGGKLGPLGSRIVMETFHAALEASQNSIVSVSSSNVTTVEFDRLLRLGIGKPLNKFALDDVVAVANGGID